MELKDIEISTFKYDFEITISAENLQEPYLITTDFILNVILEKDYDDDYFPYFEITAVVPNYVYRAMKEDHSNVNASVNMKKAKYNKYLIDSLDDTPHFSSHMSGSFMIFMDDESPELTEKYQSNYENVYGGKNDGMSNQDQSVIQISLYNKNYLTGSKNVTSLISKTSNLMDNLTYVINQAGLSNILISPPENTTASNGPPFYILPLKAYEEIEYLCNEYHMHSNGTMIFFDLDKIYILNKKPECTAYETNEFKKTYLSSFSNTKFDNNLLFGSYINGKEKWNMCIVNQIEVVINSYTNDFNVGNNIRIMDMVAGTTSTISSGAKSLSDGKISNVLSINHGNMQTTGALSSQLKEDSNVLNILLIGSDLDSLKPNKEFILSLDNMKYNNLNGSYRMTSIKSNFKKEGKYFVPYSLCQFKGGKV